MNRERPTLKLVEKLLRTSLIKFDLQRGPTKEFDLQRNRIQI